MKIVCLGTGYVGLVTAVVMAELGHQVHGLDVDNKKIAQLKKGQATIYEPGLEPLLTKHIRSKKLVFTSNYPEALKQAEIVFICVGTPPKKDGSYDLKYVFSAAKSIAENLDHYCVIAIKSTVPPSTTEKVKAILEKYNKIKLDLASVPEFLREGSAVNDALNPSRIILGVQGNQAEKILRKAHQKLKSPVLITDPHSAQLTKYASNAMLATRISFMNAIAILCDKIGADIKSVSEGLGLDPRIGKSFLQAGLGYGGSCFPKDTWALIAFAKTLGYDFGFLKQVDQVNSDQVKYFVQKIKSAYKDGLTGKIITVLGLSFKANTDDLRESRSIPLIHALKKEKAIIHTYDPVVFLNAKPLLPKVKFFKDPYLALINSDGLVLATDWQEFQDLNFKKVRDIMAQPNIFDGRNFYNPKVLKKLKFNYFGIGQS